MNEYLKNVPNNGDACYKVRFGKVTVMQYPRLKDSRGENNERTYAYYPHDCRVRNLTYKSDIKAEVWIEKYRLSDDEDRPVPEGDPIYKTEPVTIDFGSIPVMLRSKPCHLRGILDNREYTDEQKKQKITEEMKECAYDSGGYFIINGSEKVIVAQERQACNIVLVFQNKLPNDKFWGNVQVRSQLEGIGRPGQQVKLLI